MDSQNHLVNELEERLFLIVETKSVDLTCDGQVILERMSSPLSEEKKELNYYLHTTSDGVIVGQLKLSEFDQMVKVEAELSIKKFIKPQLSLSSAHVAVLIHSLKSLIQRVKLQSTEGEALSWKLDRVQRRVKLEKPVSLSLESCIWLLRQLAKILIKVSKLSLEVIQEEAEYYKAIERWPYARRAYLSWHSLGTLSFDQLQEFLMILQNLKDWRACLNLLEESIERYDQSLGAKLAFAAAILCKDVLLDEHHAISLLGRALELEPENQQYQQYLSSLQAQEFENKEISEELLDSDNDLELPDQELSSSLKQDQDDDFDPFFDEQSLTSDQLKPITDEPQEAIQESGVEAVSQHLEASSEPEDSAVSGSAVTVDEPVKQVTSSSKSNGPTSPKAGHKSKRSKKQRSKNKKKSKKKSGKRK